MGISNWNAGIIRPVPVAPTGSYATSTAPGVWTRDQAAYWQKQGLWPTAGKFPPLLFITGTTQSVNSGSQVNIDASDNLYLPISSSDPILASSSQTACALKIPSSLSSLTWQRNFYNVGSGAESQTARLDTAGTLFSFSYGFYYEQVPNANRPFIFEINPSTGVPVSYKRIFYTGYYTSQSTFVYTTGASTFKTLYGDYNSTPSLGGNLRFMDIAYATNTVTNTNYYGGSNNNGTNATAAIYNGTNWYVVGQSAETGQAADRAFVAKFSNVGVLVWWKTYGTTSQNNYGGAINVDSSANIYSSYRYRNVGAGEWYPVIQKHNTSGTKLWEFTWAAVAEITSCHIDATGRIFYSGSYSVSSVSKFVVFEINSSGTVLWINELRTKTGATNTYSFSGTNGNRLIEDSSGNLIAVLRATDTGNVLSNTATAVFKFLKSGAGTGSISDDIEYVASAATFSSFTSTAGPTTAATSGTFSGATLTTVTPTQIATNDNKLITTIA